MSHAAHRPPKRKGPRLVLVLAVLALAAVLVTSGLWASSSLMDDDSGDASARGGKGLANGVKVWEGMNEVRGLTELAGEQLQSGVRSLSDDSDVQDATLAAAWKATCGVVMGEVQFEQASIAEFVLDQAGDLGVTFGNDGEAAVAEAVQAVVNTSANDAAEKCGDLRAAGF